MENVKKVIVICGGSSSERDISLQSGQGVFKALCELGYETTLKDFNDLKDLYELKIFDFVFIALHGHEGEGGQLQRKLDDLKIVKLQEEVDTGSCEISAAENFIKLV